jgi:hypothetical protein
MPFMITRRLSDGTEERAVAVLQLAALAYDTWPDVATGSQSATARGGDSRARRARLGAP